MKGIVLAGGLGTRLFPLTKVTNKSLLPIYNRPMIYWVIDTLVKSGVDDLFIVCGGNASGEFLRILGNGEEFGLKRIHYAYQPTPAGIADALGYADSWADSEPLAVILADNLFQDTFKDELEAFHKEPNGARIFTTEVDHPEWYGVVVANKNGDVEKIIEKPENPPSNLIATGLYFYDSSVWKRIASLTPSQRGELEITDLNNLYLKDGELKSHRLKGWWGDAGESFESYMHCQMRMYEIFQD